MPEYDAFGREIGEDTLANWRTAAPPPPAEPAAAPPAPAEPAAASQPHEEPAPAPALEPAPPSGEQAAVAPPPRPRDPAAVSGARTPPRTARRQGPRPRAVSRLILLVVLVVIGANLATGIAGRVKDAVNDMPTLTPPVAAPKAADPVGLQQGSMIRPQTLRRALADLRRRDIGRLQSLRLAPERIDATFLTSRSTLVSAQLRHDGGFRRFAESGPGFGHGDTIAYARLDPSAPQRLVRAAAERLRVPVTRIDYLVPSNAQGNLTRGAYFKGGQVFVGDARGRITRRIS